MEGAVTRNHSRAAGEPLFQQRALNTTPATCKVLSAIHNMRRWPSSGALARSASLSESAITRMVTGFTGLAARGHRATAARDTGSKQCPAEHRNTADPSYPPGRKAGAKRALPVHISTSVVVLHAQPSGLLRGPDCADRRDVA